MYLKILAHPVFTNLNFHMPMIVDLRSEEHTSELQSHSELVCRLLLEKKNLLRIPLHQGCDAVRDRHLLINQRPYLLATSMTSRLSVAFPRGSRIAGQTYIWPFTAIAC